MLPTDVSVVIPTFRRGEILLETLAQLLSQTWREILVMDQTPAHPPAVEDRLGRLAREPGLHWVRLPSPSIPAAMNNGLRQARGEAVLFLDDDIVPDRRLVEAHAQAYEPSTIAVAGQVLQPGQSPAPPRPYVAGGFAAHLDFPFDSDEPAWITNGMAGNLSVRRESALAIGGFDENFRGAAYRFETEFCRRLARLGRIRFEPRASVRHLRAPSGGIRAYGDQRRSASPAHAVGDYYFALGERPLAPALGYLARRPLRAVGTRFHLRHPWWIPVKLVGEAVGLAWAAALRLRGPRLLNGASHATPAKP
jgi:GT2 family glycosyltransferase